MLVNAPVIGYHGYSGLLPQTTALGSLQFHHTSLLWKVPPRGAARVRRGSWIHLHLFGSVFVASVKCFVIKQYKTGISAVECVLV